jgi:peroxiredoxin Q/BCP
MNVVRITLLGVAIAALQIGAVLVAHVSGADELKPGDLAPDFTLAGSDGKTYHLADLRGQRAVVLAWFPKAFTGG